MNIKPIGYIRSPYPTRFGIPRQPGLVKSARCVIVLDFDHQVNLAVRGLEEFSHIWVVFVFHSLKREWKPVVAPPRLAGKKMGVLATRSPYRPNPIGLSAVKLIEIKEKEKNVELTVEGGDFLDGTPVLDIKPYVNYSDSIPYAESAWAEKQVPSMPVEFAGEVEAYLTNKIHLKNLISETLALDPRPGYERGDSSLDGRSWGVKLMDHEIKWTVKDNVCLVLALSKTLSKEL